MEHKSAKMSSKEVLKGHRTGVLMGITYRVFHGFGQVKFADCGSVLDSSQFSILTQLPPKILLNSKVVKINPKIIILLR